MKKKGQKAEFKSRLPEGSWELIGLSHLLISEQKEMVVEQEEKTKPDYSHVFNMVDIEENARKLAVAWGDNMRDDFINQKIKLASDIMNYAKWYASCIEEKEAWISVEERLPKPQQVVLAWIPVIPKGPSIGVRTLAYYEDNKWWVGVKTTKVEHNGNPTHWMKLPSSPKI